MYREWAPFERLLIATLVVFAPGLFFAPSAMAQGDAAAARVKFANDYNAGRFRDVIADGELLSKFNVLDAQSQLIIGQAYYKAGDYAGCVRYIHKAFGASPSGTPLELLDRCKIGH